VPDTDRERALARYTALAKAYDSQFRVPGTPIRFGWDALIGLFPGFGDAAGGLLGAYGLLVGWRLGAPPAVLGRMLFTVAVDVAGGAVPALGDLFDIAWRSNSRNAALLARWLEQPGEVRRQSLALGLALVACLLLLAAAAVWLAWTLVRLLASAISG
jgi:hypothetical protein